jgi:leucyl aminopeptidase
LQAFVEGQILASYKFDELKSKKSEEKEGSEPKKELSCTLLSKKATDASFKKALADATILAETVNFSRRLGDMPGNLMTPTILADSVVEAAKGTKIKVTVWDRARIKKEGMGGLYGVAQGSHQEPRFIIMEYKGAAASKKPIVYVGKGLTFDSGGISIKPGAGMEEMKYDMCGGANVIGTLLAIAKLKLKVNAYGLIPATENMPGGAATKPGDIHTARNGKTFEVNNTDAEGRLILSDALCYGSELNPQMMVDAATLTGAMVVALGNTHTGYFTRDQRLKGKIEKAAQTSGEWVWNMPLTDFHFEDMKGTFADMSNISSGKGAGSATAAAFLEQFVGEGIPWAHFDIAGTAWAVGNRLNYCSPKGASGAMIRTFVALAKQFE